jgi:hypothetical protein
MVGEAGIEPTTPSLEGSCSIQLSYSPARVSFDCSGRHHPQGSGQKRNTASCESRAKLFFCGFTQQIRLSSPEMAKSRASRGDSRDRLVWSNPVK